MVIKPASNALSCKEFRHNPFLGFNLFFSSEAHGAIWLAIKKAEFLNPVIQQVEL